MYAIKAVNCGIRRARGQFILPGVIDLFYSDELMDFISNKKLVENERYRVDRCDVNREVVKLTTLKEQLDYCKKNIIRINSHLHSDVQYGLPDLHTNASGDFQLMSRKYWHLLRGYFEGGIITAHVDGLLSYASYAAGVKEVDLADPMRIYHIDHDFKFIDRETKKGSTIAKWKWLSPFLHLFNIVSRRMFPVIRQYKKVRIHGIPTISYEKYLKISRDVVNKKRSYVFNDENWGLGNITLEEHKISKADWDK